MRKDMKLCIANAIGVALVATGCGSGVAASAPGGPPVSAPPVATSAPPTTPLTTPSPTAPPMSQTAAFNLVSVGGYTETATLNAGAIQHFSPGLANGNLVAGSQCTINPQRDAVVPLKLTVTETTPGTMLKGQAVVLNIDDHLLGLKAYAMNIEQATAPPPRCAAADYSPQGPQVSVGTHQGSRTSSVSAFLVIRDFYTPDAPNGHPEYFGTTSYAQVFHLGSNSTSGGEAWRNPDNPAVQPGNPQAFRTQP